jgi:putative aminopeptidase FrvX
VSGNSYATIAGSGDKRVMLAGHIDEIGLQITHIDKEGYLYVDGIGGWDPQVLVGQRVTILARGGDVTGVVGKKAIHLMTPEDRTQASKIKNLWVDVGASSRDEVLELGVRVGDPMVIAQPMARLAGDRIASRAIDNRIGAFVVLEAIRMLSGEPPFATATAVATVQEEIGYSGGGARTSAYRLEPDLALVVDVTFSTDVPDVEKKELGSTSWGVARCSAAAPRRTTRCSRRWPRPPKRRAFPSRSRRLRSRPARTPTASTSPAVGCQPRSSPSRTATCTRRTKW